MINFNVENLEKLERAFQYVNEYYCLADARDIYNLLDKMLAPDLERQDTELYKKFKLFKVKFGFLAISLLPEKDFFNLFENYFKVALIIPYYNLWENLKKYLIAMSDYDERDRIKLQLKNILIKNKAKITKINLFFNQKEVTGTLENWLRDYHSNLGTGPVDKLKFEQYFIASANIKRLNQEEREKLKTIFQFYERLKLSSKTPLGFEEEIPIEINGVFNIWKEGRLEDFEPIAVKAVEELKKLGVFGEVGVDKIEELQSMLSNYPEGSLEHKAIEEEIVRMEREGGSKKVE